MSITASHFASYLLLSLLVPWSCCMPLTVSYGCLLSLIVCPSSMELLHVSQDLLLLMAVSHCLCSRMELLNVYNCLLCLLAIYHRLSKYL